MSQSERGADQVEAPDLVGLTVPIARRVGHDSGIVVIGPDLDGPPLGALAWPGTWIVTAQDPSPGHRVPRGATVTIEFEKFRDDGDAGDREPRRPLPQPQAVQAERDPRQEDEQEGRSLSGVLPAEQKGSQRTEDDRHSDEHSRGSQQGGPRVADPQALGERDEMSDG